MSFPPDQGIHSRRIGKSKSHLTFLRDTYQSLSLADKYQFIEKMSPEAYEQFRFFTDIMLRDCQLVQPGNWRYWLFLGGRGTGKSKAIAVEMRKRVYQQQIGMMLISPTHKELNSVMIKAVIDEFPDKHRPIYVGGDQGIIKFHNGITVDCRTSQQGDIRGPNNSMIFLDELVACWDKMPDKIEEKFNILDASVRKGNAQIMIATTGAPWNIFRRWLDMWNSKNPLMQVRTGRMKDNEYLAPLAKQALYQQFAGSRYEAQELDGIINFDIDGALWSPKIINSTRKLSIEEVANPPNPNNIRNYNNPLDFFIKFVIGADPATTAHANSDAWGIMVAALGRDNHLYILEDCSKILSPNDAVNEIARLHQKYRNCQVVAEVNQGGDMVDFIMRTKMPYVSLKQVHAHQNKMSRAQPVSILWEQGRAHMVGKFEELEKELCEFTGDPKQESPNRLDAMVYAAQWLLLEKNIRLPAKTWLPQF